MIVIAVSILGVSSTEIIATSDINVEINGEPLHFCDNAPVIVDGRTFIPMHGVFEHLGFDVTWNNAIRTAAFISA